MAFLYLVVCSLFTYLLGWLITGESDAGQWELWFRLVAVILAILWTMRSFSNYNAKGKS